MMSVVMRRLLGKQTGVLARKEPNAADSRHVRANPSVNTNFGPTCAMHLFFTDATEQENRVSLHRAHDHTRPASSSKHDSIVSHRYGSHT